MSKSVIGHRLLLVRNCYSFFMLNSGIIFNFKFPPVITHHIRCVNCSLFVTKLSIFFLLNYKKKVEINFMPNPDDIFYFKNKKIINFYSDIRSHAVINTFFCYKKKKKFCLNPFAKSFCHL